jgi:hypothetical protein
MTASATALPMTPARARLAAIAGERAKRREVLALRSRLPEVVGRLIPTPGETVLGNLGRSRTVKELGTVVFGATLLGFSTLFTLGAVTVTTCALLTVV